MALDLNKLNNVEVTDEELNNVSDDTGFAKVEVAGLYKGIITKIYLDKNNFNEGNYDLMIQFKTEDGAFVDAKYGAIFKDGKENWKNKDGNFTIGANKIIALNKLVNDAKGFPEAEVGQVEVYDFTDKELVKKKKHIFPALIGKEVSALLYPKISYKQAKAEDGNYYPYADKKEEVIVERFLDAATNQTFEEKKLGEEAIKAQVWVDAKGDNFIYDACKAQLKKASLDEPYKTKEDAQAVGSDDVDGEEVDEDEDF